MNLLPLNKDNEVNTILVLPENVNILTEILNNYLLPLGENSNKVLVANVYVPEKGALKKSDAMKEIEKIYELCEIYGIENIAVSNSVYIKFFCGLKKKPSVERLIGSVLKDKKGYNIIPILNYLAVMVTPSKKHLLQKSVDTLKLVLEGKFKDNREDFVKSLKIDLIIDFEKAKMKLKEYYKLDKIAIDIETTGLEWYKDKLLTISFAKSEIEGFSIALHSKYSKDYKKNLKLIKSFFENYKGKAILHNAQFDIPFLVYNLFMQGLSDTENMVKGVNYFDIEDTMVMAYLCLNNVDRPKLSLKDLAYVKYGNWDKDIEQKNLINYSFDEVGRYNTIDTMATMFTYNEYYERLKIEEQFTLYRDFYRRFIKAVIKMKMNGMTLNKKGFEELDKQLEDIYNENLEFLNSTDEVKETIEILKEEAKSKGKRQSEINKIEFNPKSTNHLRVLLFDVLGLPIIKESKKTGLPATDKEVIEKLLNEVNEYSKEYKIVKAIKEISEMKQVKSTFIDGLLQKGVFDDKGNFKIYGNFNITGTISGRMSSNNPNLLNLPSNSKYGKLVKKNLIASNSWWILQADSDQLEDRLITSVTGCKNKARVFQLGLDAHSNNAFAYWQDKMLDIKEKLDKLNKGKHFYMLKNGEVVTDLDVVNEKEVEKEITKEEYEVKVINSIKNKYPELRQESKKYTFKMAYGGITDFSPQYEQLYKEVFDFVDLTEKELLNKGYVTGFLGLKVRGNLKAIKNKQAYQSALRSIFNMRTQSGALIIAQAIFNLQEWIESKGYETKVKIINSVYDSIYIEIYDNAKIIAEVANKLTQLMCPDYHQYAPQIFDESCYIPLGAEAEIGKSWVAEATIPNNTSVEEVKEILQKLKQNS